MRTLSVAPIVLMAVFGGGAFACLVAALVFTRFFLEASRLYRINENIASTEDGKTLLDLQAREACLTLILDGAPAEEERAQTEE